MEKKELFKWYLGEAEKTAIYKESVLYPSVGLVGEAGEVADKVKKVMRDRDGMATDDDKLGIAYELGDVLWYLFILLRDKNIEIDSIVCQFDEDMESDFVKMKVPEMAVRLCSLCATTAEFALSYNGKDVYLRASASMSIACAEAMALRIGYTLEDVAKMNVNKLASRQERNMIHGSGDNR